MREERERVGEQGEERTLADCKITQNQSLGRTGTSLFFGAYVKNGVG
jgi:hypothetical protein